MTPKRIVLSVLTLLVALVMGQSLVTSLGEPQVGNRLQLYQTDLLVQASEWQGSGLPDAEVQQFRTAVFGEDALKTAIETYREVREDATSALVKLQQRLSAAQTMSDAARKGLLTTANTQQQLIDQIDLRLGVVQARQGDIDTAQETWAGLIDRNGELSPVAATLSDLWKTPPVVRSQAEATIGTKLRGWYQYSALTRLYEAENKTQQQQQLLDQERQLAEKTLLQLSVVSILPSLGGLLGAGLLIALIGQRLLRGKDSLLALNDQQWPVPWNWEVVWQVVVGGFLFTGQIALPLFIALIRDLFIRPTATAQAAALPSFSTLATVYPYSAELHTAMVAATSPFLALSSRGRALSSLVFYVLMAAVTLAVLYWSIKPHLPLAKEWFAVKFSGKWLLWGWGGYLVALPLMLGISWINQQIWQGQGGNNPILQLVLEERDPVALGMFLFTAAIAAPVFEEILFRGFLLPSLTRYTSAWGAIGLSSLIFSVAHLSFSEVLPLTVLGAILGFVYVRSRNLMSSILLHSTWNSVTMLGLFLLGSGGR